MLTPATPISRTISILKVHSRLKAFCLSVIVVLLHVFHLKVLTTTTLIIMIIIIIIKIIIIIITYAIPNNCRLQTIIVFEGPFKSATLIIETKMRRLCNQL